MSGGWRNSRIDKTHYIYRYVVENLSSIYVIKTTHFLRWTVEEIWNVDIILYRSISRPVCYVYFLNMIQETLNTTINSEIMVYILKLFNCFQKHPPLCYVQTTLFGYENKRQELFKYARINNCKFFCWYYDNKL